MITNREQHELAAKAAGLAITWKTGSCKGGEVEAAFVGDQPWRPKEDDGDAFRLQVMLSQLDGGLALMLNSRFNSTGFAQCYTNENTVSPTEYMADDPYAATRLAIFRAAIEIGKAMP